MTKKSKKTETETYLCSECNEVTEHSVERDLDDDSDILTCTDCDHVHADMRDSSSRSSDMKEWFGIDIDSSSSKEDILMSIEESKEEKSNKAGTSDPEGTGENRAEGDNTGTTAPVSDRDTERVGGVEIPVNEPREKDSRDTSDPNTSADNPEGDPEAAKAQEEAAQAVEDANESANYSATMDNPSSPANPASTNEDNPITDSNPE